MSRDIQQDIVDMYKAGKEVHAIRAATGYTNQAIYQILDRHGVEMRKNVRRGRRSTSELPDISPSHVQLGATISYQRTFNLKLSRSEAAKPFGLSIVKLTQLEQGKYDPTLGELQRIASQINIPVVELVRYREVVRAA